MPELSALEKALAKVDFPAEIQPLDAVIRALRQGRTRSLQELDMDARGRLITTLSRVARQPRPPDDAPAAPEASGVPPEGEGGAGPTSGEAASVDETAPAEAAGETAPAEAAGETAPAETAGETAPAETAGETAPAVAAGETAGTGSEGRAAPAPASEASGASVPPGGQAAPAPGAPPPLTPARAYGEVLFRVGLAWSAVGEQERAEAAFSASGRQPGPEDLRVPEPAETPAGAPAGRGRPGKERPARGERRERLARPARPPREERPTGPGRAAPLQIPPELAGDWKAQADFLESRGRTRDAARLHEKHGGFADAARLFEAGGDLRSALRTALGAKDAELARKLASQLPPSDAQTTLEKAEAWELLMELHVRSGRFEEVAKLYERARQFDQAGLAWERAGKLGPARKAFERAHDVASADRVRTLEVDRLVERGDRLGAALLLVQARRREQAAKLLEPLPPPKAFRFLQQLGLDAEAKALGERELQSATDASKSMARARWLELLDRPAEAAEAWEAAGRKDKAFPLLEKAGQFGRGARVAEELGNRNEAIRLFRRAGEDAEADRLEALPPAPAPEPLPEPADPDGEETGEGIEASPEAGEGSGASEPP